MTTSSHSPRLNIGRFWLSHTRSQSNFNERFFFSVVNFFFSLYWDIVVDWDLGHWTAHKTNLPATSSQMALSSHPEQCRYFLLRPSLSFHPLCYYLAILINSFCRSLWIFRFINPEFPFALSIQSWEFTMKAIEISRRFIWVIFRIEREWTTVKANNTWTIYNTFYLCGIVSSNGDFSKNITIL